ncbi:MAG: response regulator transcription factor [Myxococcales bacterium]|nr:response regulator transcription factor [Myxococcales bacterium]
MAKKVLVIEDERDMAEILVDNLEAEGYDVTSARDGREGVTVWHDFSPDLVILDVMLPHLSGYDVCRTMREEGYQTPVLFLSAKGQPEARVQGLASGGDDYLTKPFHLPELLLRVRALLQRSSWQAQNTPSEQLKIGPHLVDLRAWSVASPDGKTLLLREEEVRLLRYLSAHPRKILARDVLLDGVWQDDIFPSSRVLEGYFQRLREIFESDPLQPRYFHSYRGLRFAFYPNGNESPFEKP